jgi:hypothetical protein
VVLVLFSASYNFCEVFFYHEGLEGKGMKIVKEKERKDKRQK